MKRIQVLLLIGALACGGDTGPKSPPAPGSLQLLISSASDTIDATLTTPLTVVARSVDGALQAGAIIRFTVLASKPGGYPGLQLEGMGSDASLSVPTGADGRAVAHVTLGDSVGSFAVEVAEAGLAHTDTAHFSVLPGNTSHVQLSTHDTMTTVGQSYTPTLLEFDRKGNAATEKPTLTSTSPACGANGSTILGAAVGNCVVSIQFASARDSIVMAVVPSAQLIFTVGTTGVDSVLSMNLDGSHVRLWGTIVQRAPYYPYHLVKSATYPYIALDLPGTDNRIHVVWMDSLGNRHPLGASLPPNSDDLWPNISPDGQWIYFSSRNDPTAGYQVWRAHLDGTAATALTVAEAFHGVVSNFADVSSDGGTLAYGPTLRLMNLGTGQVTPIPQAIGWTKSQPRTNRFAQLQSNDSVAVLFVEFAADGSGMRTLTDTSYCCLLDWTPDAQWILTRLQSKDVSGNTISGDWILRNDDTGQKVWIRWKLKVQEASIVR